MKRYYWLALLIGAFGCATEVDDSGTESPDEQTYGLETDQSAKLPSSGAGEAVDPRSGGGDDSDPSGPTPYPWAVTDDPSGGPTPYPWQKQATTNDSSGSGSGSSSSGEANGTGQQGASSTKH